MRSAEVVAARRRWALVAAGLLGAACGPALGASGAELARSQGCMGCHALDQKVVGPAFVDVAKRYASDAAAVDKVAQRIAVGSSGVWGAVAMPPQPQLKPDEAISLARWIMGAGTGKP